MSKWSPTEDEWRTILDAAAALADAIDDLRRLMLDGAATPADAARVNVDAGRLAAAIVEARQRRPRYLSRVSLAEVSPADAARHRAELVDAMRSDSDT